MKDGKLRTLKDLDAKLKDKKGTKKKKLNWLMRARKTLAIIRSSHVIKVWPSAYASGALVKCRKVGAANWGNSKKR